MTEPVVIYPSGNHTATFIFLHGLDDIGKTWFDDFNYFNLPKSLPYMKFVFPTAPIMKISKNNGEEMTSWFDVHGFDQIAKEDQQSIERASQFLNSFVEAETKHGIPVERIIIGGFSMGGAVALYTVLTSSDAFGGVISLSTWLPLRSTFPKALIAGEKKKTIPILHCHGNKDSIIHIDWARLSEECFKSMGFQKYTFKEYDGMDHTDCEQVSHFSLKTKCVHNKVKRLL
ncbi:unnamed protein product [Adineta ricciae]|uniref:palmitoyl-protein hydrolase n=1 Tax=Adineta ricciae TaxID=249248 RepID=A0A815SSZ0_ADIRI|nr:unnamed protein product [Adineta ricciae]